jgi:mediator of RNA polymerase II transcription subunit 14
MASHYTNLKELHDRRIRHILKSNRSPSSINIPPIYIRLSELIEPKRELPRKVNMRAKDILRLTFQGLEPLYRKGLTGLPSSTPQPQPLSSPDPKSMASEPETSAEETAKVISEARMVVPVPASFKILKEKVDEDIAFHMQSGTFAFRLRSVVGEPVISALVERAIHIENLIEFVEVLHKHEKTLKCENISLGKIVFSYGSTAVENTFQYEAVVNFAAINTMTLSFKKGNPHLRIADHLSKILNAGGGLGLDGVANLLPLTLPALRGLETIEAAWTPLTDKGEALVFVRAVEWYILRYNLFSTLPEAPTRKVMFEIKLQQRRGEPWWLIRRIDARDKEGDDIDAQLKPIWISEGGQGWKGMRVNAVAELTGVEELMAKVDDVLRDHVSGTQTGGLQAAPQPQRPAPVAPMANMGPNQAKGQRPNMQNPPRQQPTPQQSQSSQGRGNAAKRPIKVEIDLT